MSASRTTGLGSSPRLSRLARGQSSSTAGQDGLARCDLCGEPLEQSHRHLIDLSSRRILCGCRACSILFDHSAAGGGHYRLLPKRRHCLTGFSLDDSTWTALGLPIELAFFFYSSPVGRVVAFYPGPMGAVESALELGAWQTLVAQNPVVAELEPDVEALLVKRSPTSQYWIVPVDDCYRLVGLMRASWRGLSGGQEVWEQIERFFAELGRSEQRTDARAGKDTLETASTCSEKEKPWQS